MYCVKCKKHTDTVNVEQVITKNNRCMKKGICTVCGSTKTQFVGAGLMNTLINKLPFEMHLPGYNFAGPGTRLNKRLNSDLTPKPWSKPINKVDNAAYNHDICYLKHSDTKTRNNLCDKTMLKELDGIYNPTLREKLDKSIIKRLLGLKINVGMGLKIV